MKLRTFFIIALWLASIFAIVHTFLSNRELIRVPFTLWPGTSISVGLLLLIAFTAGALFVFIAGIPREAGLIFERWRSRRTGRRAEEIEEEYTKGLAAMSEGRDDAALIHFHGALERDSRHFNTLIKIGEVLRRREQFDAAIEYHRKAHHLRDDSTLPLFALVDDHEACGDMERARAVLRKIIGLDRNAIVAWRKLRSLYVKERNWDKALEAHERVMKISAEGETDAADRRIGVGIRYEIAAAQYEDGKIRDAIVGLRRLLKDEPSFIPAHIRVGEALNSMGQETEAVQAWISGFESTGSPIFLTALEDHYLIREEPLQAIEALKSCVSRSVKDTLPRFWLGKLYLRLEMLDDAQATLGALVGRASYAPTLHFLLGRIHERRQKWRDAANEYRRVIRETDLVQLEYLCRSCGETLMEWTDRCLKCGEWNRVEVNFREEIPLDELGLPAAPIYPDHY